MASDLCPHFSPRIFRMHFPELPEQFARALVPRIGRFDRDLDDLVAVLPRPRVENALLAHTEALSILCALRNLELRAPVDGRHFDLRPERGFPHCNGNRDLDVVALAPEERVFLDSGCDV